MSLRIRGIAASSILLLGVAVVAAQQPVRQPVRQPATPGAAAQPRQPAQPGQIGQPGQPGQPGQIGQRQPGQSGQRGQWDQQLITMLIIDNNKEIALGQLGERTTKNEQVREFCQMIQKDHGEIVQKLQELSATSGSRGARTGSQAGDIAVQPGRAANPAAPAIDRNERSAEPTARQDQDRDRGQRDLARDESQSESSSRQTVAKPVISNAPGSELLQFCQEVAEECVNSSRKDAQKHSAEKFDMYFVGAQLVAHKGMLDKLRVAERHASPQLAQLLKDGQATTEQHLEHAEQLIEKLGEQENRGGATRERSADRDAAPERREQ